MSHLIFWMRGKKLKAVELGVCSSSSSELISLRGQEVSQGGPTSAAPPGLSCTSAPSAPCQALQNLPAAENSPQLCHGAMGMEGVQTAPDWPRNTNWLSCWSPGTREGTCTVRCPAQTGHDPAGMEMGQELQLLLAKAPQPFISSCFSPSLVPHFWWQQWHLGFVY